MPADLVTQNVDLRLFDTHIHRLVFEHGGGGERTR